MIYFFFLNYCIDIVFANVIYDSLNKCIFGVNTLSLHKMFLGQSTVRTEAHLQYKLQGSPGVVKGILTARAGAGSGHKLHFGKYLVKYLAVFSPSPAAGDRHLNTCKTISLQFWHSVGEGFGKSQDCASAASEDSGKLQSSQVFCGLLPAA